MWSDKVTRPVILDPMRWGNVIELIQKEGTNLLAPLCHAEAP